MALLVGAVGSAVAASSTQSALVGYGYPYPPPPPPSSPPTAPTEPTAPTTHALSVTKGGSGTGNVTGSGIACGSDCSEAYPAGTSVTLTAVADAGSTFTGWSGACSGTGACAVLMDAPKSVTATFTLAQGAAPSQSQDTTLQASVTRVEVVVRAGKRIVRTELSLEEAVKAELQLKRRGQTLARKTVSLSAGGRLVTIRIPAGVAAGRANLRILLEDTAGNDASFARSVRLPSV
jgi:hypothetical protein